MATKIFSRSLSSAFRQTTRPSSNSSIASHLTKPLAIRSLSTETRQAIDKAVSSAPVVLFMKGTPNAPQCGFSSGMIKVLGMTGVDPKKFSAFNVLEDEGLRQGIKEYSDWPTIPQLYVDKEFLGGVDIVVAMHSNGELSKLFEEKKVLAPLEGEDSK